MDLKARCNAQLAELVKLQVQLQKGQLTIKKLEEEASLVKKSIDTSKARTHGSNARMQASDSQVSLNHQQAAVCEDIM